MKSYFPSRIFFFFFILEAIEFQKRAFTARHALRKHVVKAEALRSKTGCGTCGTIKVYSNTVT